MSVPEATPHAAASLFTWLGATVFVISLTYFLLSYETRFGIPAAGSAPAPAIAWDVALFTLFAVHHSVCARLGVRGWIARMAPPPLERSVYVWIASLLFIVVCAFWRPVPGIVWDVDGIGAGALRLLQVAGVWLTLRSAVLLDIRELAGIRRPEDQVSEPEFKTTGPYGWVRHPIYAGWFLMVFAGTPMTMTRLVFAVTSSAYLLIAIPLEERSMRAGAEAAYERYMRRVRWRLVPGVY